jgi:hypothetical protein
MEYPRLQKYGCPDRGLRYLMRIRKAHLRVCARAALESRGFSVTIKSGPGIVTGARLLASRGSEVLEIAVRTSLDREVGLTRDSDGRWLTVTKMDEVVVVAPSANDPHCAEVSSFDPAVLVGVFNQALAELKEKNPKISTKAPVFVALDSGTVESSRAGLIARAAWTSLVPLASVPQPTASSSGAGSNFVDRVKREFAALVGVDVNTVRVEFHIIA